MAQMLRDALSRVMEVMQNQEVLDHRPGPDTKDAARNGRPSNGSDVAAGGHADVVMDGVGPEVIPTVETIRAKFTVRRQGQGFDKIIQAARAGRQDAAISRRRHLRRAAWAWVGMSGLE